MTKPRHILTLSGQDQPARRWRAVCHHVEHHVFLNGQKTVVFRS